MLRLIRSGGARPLLFSLLSALLLGGAGGCAQHASLALSPASSAELEGSFSQAPGWHSRLVDDGKRLQIFPSQQPNQLKGEVAFSDMLVDEHCLYLSPNSNNLYAFVQDGRGRSEQWLLTQQGKALPQAQLIRALNVGLDTSACAADHGKGYLYMVEQGVGVWRYRAEPEAMPERVAVAMQQPWGELPVEVEALQLIGSDLLLLTPSQLHWLKLESTDFHAQGELTSWNLPVEGAEQFRAQASTQGVALTLWDDETEQLLQGELPIQVSALADPAPIAEVFARYETPPAAQTGDAMDDPAIWLHPTDPSRSLVLGTHKKLGLYVYNLQGQTLQLLEDGRLNNVDVRTLKAPTNGLLGLAVASLRDDNSVVIYGIDSNQGVSRLGQFNTPLAEIYGICMGELDGQFYAFPNDKDGRVLQYQLLPQPQGWHGKLVRELAVASQPEGCVVDDARAQLFVGEEDEGIWVTSAKPSDKPNWKSVAKISDVLHDDVEGIALAKGAQGEPDLLVVSSQGNDSYVLLEANPPYAYQGRFRVGLNSQTGIDGSSETDGLDVSTAAFNGDFPEGLLVVQDGRNLMPDEPQNFKLISWQQIKQKILR